jgi:hypothetical protein
MTSLTQFTQPALLQAIGQPRLARLFEEFALDLQAANLVAPKSDEGGLLAPNAGEAGAAAPQPDPDVSTTNPDPGPLKRASFRITRP